MTKSIAVRVALRLLWITVAALSVSPAPALDFARPQKHAVLIGSAGGDAVYSKKHWELLSGMHRVLTEKMDFAPEQIYLLFEDASRDPKIIGARSTKVEVEKLFRALATKLGGEDLLFVLIIGHGTYDGEVSKINLPGPDITDGDLALMVKMVKAKYRVIVNATSASGEFVKTLSGHNTVVITATKSGWEKTDTRFPKFFVEAFETAESDANKDDMVSLAEAYEYAVRKVEQAFKNEGMLVTEHALLEDRGHGPGQHTLEGQSAAGALARRLNLGGAAASAGVTDPQLKRLFAERREVENRIAALKARKSEMAAVQYQTEFESLAVQLAKLSRQIRQASGKKEP
ncbi:MAG: caspase family protein [Acidobacteria bacterium]|nr:caspase family protein [Acidobacteriota bacterium]MBI3656301.1 caspase family protein [Acidobacteriota bacterium]